MPTLTSTTTPVTPIAPPTQDPGQALRATMRHFPTGVALLSAGRGEQAIATTINGLMSVSLAPPQILVSIGTTSRVHAVLEADRCYTVNLFSSEQAELARLFATPAKPTGRALARHLRPTPTSGRDGLGPDGSYDVLPGALATITCGLAATYPGGDHTLFLGDVVHAAVHTSAPSPLLFHQGQLVSHVGN
ncbi:flavin reductase family protein [Streptomyces sp. NBC_00237]|uniref:flavin reductase family protein n=1 Tax=Streptomyces sp. NBC_00237 TaxID=2975687 RepID=UPI002253584C|nr:flavin reductase family protein [Streptomyces sp. NBC_00237]MCX5206710.1 flavin reductase family protein [Streptomyces sp. NBC_00237]